MKKSNYELYEIIAVLDDSEKRYIRKLLKNNLYHNDLIFLFNLIEKFNNRPQLDENELILRFKKQHFTKRKFELYQIIQNNLVNFKKDDISKIVRNQLIFCQYLFDKGLLEICEKKLKKLKEQVADLDNNLLKLEILALEKTLFFSKRGSINEESRLQIELEEKENIVQITESQTYWHLLAQIFEIQFQKLKIDNIDKKKLLQQVKNNALLGLNYQPKNFYSWVIKNQILSTLAFLEGDLETAYNTTKLVIERYKEKPLKIEEFPKKYFAIWSNHIINCSSMYKEEELSAAISEMRDFLNNGKFTKIPNLEGKVLMRIYNIELNSILKYKNFDNSMEVVDNFYIDIGKKLMKQTSIRIAILCFLAAQIAYINGATEKAKVFLSQAYLNEKRKQVEDVVVACRMLEIIIFYEEGELSLVDKFLTRLKNYLKYRKINQEFENQFVKLIEELLIHIDKKQLKAVYSKYLFVFGQKTNLPIIYSFLFMEEWLSTKHKGSKFMEALNRKTP